MNKLSTTILTLALAVAASSVSAQLRTAYFMDESIFRYEQNAALIPSNGYVNIPFVGQMGVDVKSNYLMLRNFVYPNSSRDGAVTFMNSSVSSDKFLSRMRNNNKLGANVTYNIFGIGNHTRRGFWSFSLDMRAKGGVALPKDLFGIIKKTSTGTYNLDKTSAELNSWLEAAAGWSMDIDDDWSIGFRVKALAGIANLDASFGNFTASLDSDEYRVDASAVVEGNVIGFSTEDMAGKSYTASDFVDRVTSFNNFSLSNMGSFGATVDLGVERKLLDDRLRVSAALNDLGFIAWGKRSSFRASTGDVAVSFKGLTVEDEKLTASIDRPDQINLSVAESGGGAKAINANFITGAEYSFFGRKMSVGALYSLTRFTHFMQHELTASVTWRPLDWLTVAGSQSLVNSRLLVTGAALNLHPGWINFFVGTDFISLHYAKGTYDTTTTTTAESGTTTTTHKYVVPVNQKSFNLYFGLSVPLRSISRANR